MPAFSGVPNAILPRVLGTQPGGVLTPGYYSNLAFQMAGSPQNGPYSAVAPPPDPVGGYGIPSASGAAGGAAGSALGTLATNPSLLKGAYNTIGGLLSPAVGSPAWEAAVTSGTSAGIPAASAIAAPTAADVGASIGAPVGGDLYAGALGAAGADAGAAGTADAAAALGDSAVAGGTAAGSGASSALGTLGTAAATYALPAALAALAIFGPTGVPPQDANFVTSLKGMPNLPPGLLDEINNAYGKYGEAGFGQWWAQNMPSAYPNNSPGPVGPNRARVNQT